MPWGKGTSLSGRRRALALVLGCTAASSVVLAVILFVFTDFHDVNDFPHELLPAYRALSHGHPREFIDDLPPYFGTAIVRAPLALIALACGAGWRLTFFLTAIPCYSALPLYGLWLSGRTEYLAGDRRRAVVVFALILVVNPIVWFTGLLGHPEELVGIALGLAAVLVARENRPILAGLLIVLSIISKPGLAELLPVVLVALHGRYVKPALMLCLAATVLYALYNVTPLYRDVPIWHLSSGASTQGVFFPFQFLWWLGRNSWLVTHEHVLLVPVCVALAAAWKQRMGDAAPDQRDLLWLTAFMLLFRTAFEPWDNVYYNLPLIICLLTLEFGELPVRTVLATVLVLVLVPTNRLIPLSQTGQAVLFTVIVAPSLLALGWRAYRDPARVCGPDEHGAPALA